MCVRACVHVCVRVYAYVYVRACVRACVPECVHVWLKRRKEKKGRSVFVFSVFVYMILARLVNPIILYYEVRTHVRGRRFINIRFHNTTLHKNVKES